MFSAGSLNLEELTNVIPLHLLLTYLVHQIEAPQIPSLPDFLRRSKSEYLESEAVPLWEEKPKAMENLKANVMRLSDAWLLTSRILTSSFLFQVDWGIDLVLCSIYGNLPELRTAEDTFKLVSSQSRSIAFIIAKSR